MGKIAELGLGFVADRLGYRLTRNDWENFADGPSLAKARNTLERMREVVSDPLNHLIVRVPDAGYVDKDANVRLHNGNRVPVTGEHAYYGDFSDMLVVNRGVHEPLEEFCFQEVLKRIKTQAPVMIELGAYWAHYSMWLKKVFPAAGCTMVEPSAKNLASGRNNFALNGFEGTFIQAFVSSDGFTIDKHMTDTGAEWIDILHSDIQGYEDQMLAEASETLSAHRAGYVFVSTHSDALHEGVEKTLRGFGYRVEASSRFSDHTTSFDGFVLASGPKVERVFDNLAPWGRHDIAAATGPQIVRKLEQICRAAGLGD